MSTERVTSPEISSILNAESLSSVNAKVKPPLMSAESSAEAEYITKSAP